MLVILRTDDPADLSPSDLDGLADELRTLASTSLPELEVEVQVSEPFGSGAAWNDILTMVLPSISLMSEHQWEKLVDCGTRFMAGRFKRKYEQSRPRVLVLVDGIDPDRRVEISIKIDPATGDIYTTRAARG